MYPGFLPYWRSRRCGGARVETACGPEGHRYAAAGEEEQSQFSGGSFGVRRPLRYLAYKLQLEDAQVAELAKILDELKTERAQAAVDHRRAISAFADAIDGDAFNEERAKAGAAIRLESAERLRAAVLTALGRLQKLLGRDQRAKLAYLIRTGALSI